MKLNLDKAKEILTLLQEDTITPQQVKVLIAHLVELSEEKKEELFSEFQNLLDNVSQQTYQKIQETISILNEKANDNQLEVRQLTNKQQKAHDKKIEELQLIVAELKAIKYKDGKDGKDGKDADEAKIVEEVLSRVPKQLEYELLGENVVDSINALDTKPENQIDAKHIKNLPENKGDKFYGGSGIKEIIAGTNITVDNTNLGYPVVSATGGGSGITRSINSISAPTTAGATASTDYVYFVSGTTTLTLPTAVGNTNMYTIKNTGSATVTVDTTSSQTIDGALTLTINTPYSYNIISNNSNWFIV